MGQTQLRKKILIAQGYGKQAWLKHSLDHRIQKYLDSPSYVPLTAFFKAEVLTWWGRVIRKRINAAAQCEVLKERIRGGEHA